MRKKLLSVALVVAAVCTIMFLASSQSVTRAQEGGSGGGKTVEEVECPPEMCYSYPTSLEEEGGKSEALLAGCTCGIFYDADCHYEYVSAFQCLPWRHEDGDSTTEEWVTIHNHDDQWGLRKESSGDYQLDLICPIPTDSGTSSIKYYGDVAQVKGYFYHYDASDSSSMYIYSAKANDVEYHGDDDDSASGHRTISITPIGDDYYVFWYAAITVANHQTSSFHGLEICYDPD